jgi:hypothetical protein
MSVWGRKYDSHFVEGISKVTGRAELPSQKVVFWIRFRILKWHETWSVILRNEYRLRCLRTGC